MSLGIGNRGESGIGLEPERGVPGPRPVPAPPRAAGTYPIPHSRFPIPAEGNA